MKKSTVRYLKMRGDVLVKRRSYVTADGLVSDNFGIVKKNDVYMIIHLASGHSFKILHQKKAATAKKYVDFLESSGINWNAEDLNSMADLNGKTPEEIFNIVKGALNVA